ncbi:MAG: dihydrofolate reductase [Burkholderiaceae bacterium]|jgi:dihydrofolate reductase|nr:dihydrofolate reductase [Burkholderiaceae bacterium]
MNLERRPRIGLIFARAENGVIGKDGVMPWHLPDDLAHFKRVTQGCPVIMGRHTWQSIPPRFRPLPGRRNIVLTRQPDWRAEGAETARDLHTAISLCADAPLAWIIGGAQIYAQAEPLACIAEITEIHASFAGDAYAPTLGLGWRETAREAHTAADGLRYSFVRYQRDGGVNRP